MNVTLVVVDGKVDRRQLEIRLPARLGRSRQADVTIAHSFVSRMHCELRGHEGGILLTDLGSLNGTYLGNRRVRRVLLRPGDQFTIGPLTFELHYELLEQSGIGQPADTESGAAGRAIELPDPMGPEPVELDDEVRPTGVRHDAAHVFPEREGGDRRKRTLPGFIFRAEEWEEDEGEASDGRRDGTIAIDPAHYDVGGGSSRYDAPTRQGESAGTGAEDSRAAGEEADAEGGPQD